MPALRVLPSAYILKRWVDQGMTHQQIADRVEKETGYKVGRSAESPRRTRSSADRTTTMTEPTLRNASESSGGTHTQPTDAECQQPCDHCQPDMWHPCRLPRGHTGWHTCGEVW
jgi:hypothetical protein